MKLRLSIGRLRWKRIHLLLVLLAVAAVLAWQHRESEVSIPPERTNEAEQWSDGAADAGSRAKLLPLDLTRLDRRRAESTPGNLFGQPKPQEPPPPPVAEAESLPSTSLPAVSPPGPPELPFSYIGQMIDKGETKIFLSAGAETYVVKAGDSLRGVYLVESVSSDAVAFIYLPMKMQQRLSIAPAN